MRLAGYLALGAAALALICPAAHADSLTQTVNFGPSTSDLTNGSGTTPFGSQLYLFDSSGGTLNSISYILSYTYGTKVTVTAGSQGGSGAVEGISGLRFSSNNSAVTTALNNAVNREGTFTAGTSTLSPIAFQSDTLGLLFNLGANGSEIFTPTVIQNHSVVDTSAADLAAFAQAGGGTFTPLFSTLSGLILSVTGGGASASQVLNLSGSLTLTYNYTPSTPVSVTPEPCSLLLLGTGLLAVIGEARRRAR